MVLVTHSHPDHYDEVIFEWEKTVKNLTYIFGWQAKQDPRYIYMVGNKAEIKNKGLEISTINCYHDGIPEVAFLVKVDGLVIYHSGDFKGTIYQSKLDIDYLSRKCETVDIAFLEGGSGASVYTLEQMSPLAAFPMHSGGNEFFYKGIVHYWGSKTKKTKLIAVENRGDRFLYRDRVMRQLF